MAKQHADRQIAGVATIQRGLEQQARFARGERNEEAGLRQLLADFTRCGDEGIGHVVQLGLPASGQQGKDRLLRRNVEQAARRIAAVFERQHIGQRMADVAHRDAFFLVETGLKREEREHTRDRRADLLDALAAPGPDRWTDVMNARNSALLERFFERQIDVGRIDADEYVGRFRQQTAFQIIANPGDFPVMPEHFRVTANRQLFEREPDVEALPRHFRPANPVEHGSRQFCLERLYQMAGEQISRSLAGDHGDTDDAWCHRMMPRRETARKSRMGWISGCNLTSSASLARASSSIRPDL